jgi:hypothetical protein
VIFSRTIGGVCSPCNIIVGVHIFKICEGGVDYGVMLSFTNAKGNEDGTLPLLLLLLLLVL